MFSGTLGGTVTTIPSVGVSGDDGTTLETLTGTASTVTTHGGGDYAYFDGTSMATPHVSGVAALVWSQDPTCSNQDVRDALASSALDLENRLCSQLPATFWFHNRTETTLKTPSVAP